METLVTNSASKFFINVNHNIVTIWLILITLITMVGCQDIPATNPFDPNTPAEIQAKGSFLALVESPIERYDWTQVVVETKELESSTKSTHSIAASGMLKITDLLANTYRLKILAPGHIDHVNLITLRAGQQVIGDPIILQSKKESDIETVYLSGQVMLRNQNTHGDIQVRALIGQQEQGFSLSNSDGRYSLRLSPLDHRITFSADGYHSYDLDVQWIAERAQFETVIDGMSSPVETTSISLELNPGELNGVIRLPDQTNHSGISVSLDTVAGSVITDETGAFSMKNLPKGVYRLRATKEGYQNFTLSDIGIIAGESNTLPTTESDYRLQRSTGNLSGIVLKVNDSQLSDIHVKVLGTDLSTFSDPSGAWNLRNIPTGIYSIEFSSPHHHSITLSEVRVIEDLNSVIPEQNLIPTLSASITGSLNTTIEDFDWASDCTIELKAINYPLTKTFSPLGDGRFSETSFQPGLYRIEVAAQRHYTYSSLIELNAQENDLSPITVNPEFVRLLGRVESRGEALAGVVVQARHNNLLVDSTLSDSEGHFILQVTPENHELALEHPGFIMQPIIPVQWEQDHFEYSGVDLADRPLEMERINLEGTIDVKVTINPSWLPSSERFVEVILYGNLGRILDRLTAQNDETITFSGLDEGEYLVSFERAGFSTVSQGVQLSLNQDQMFVETTVSLENLSVANINLNGEVIYDVNLRDENLLLRGARMEGVILRGGPNLNSPPADLSELDLRDVILDNADLQGAKLSGVDLRNASLRDSNLTGAIFHSGNGPNVTTKLDFADFFRADLTRAQLADPDASFFANRCADLTPSEVIVTGAQFEEAVLREATLRNLDLSGSDLSRAVLVDIDLSGSCLRGASMTLANLSGAQMPLADLRDASLFNSILVPSQDERSEEPAVPVSLVGADLTGAYLTSAILEKADLTNAILVDTNLTSANLIGAILNGVNASHVQMTGALLSEANLSSANLSHAKLLGVFFANTNIEDTDFSNADLRNTSWIDCTFDPSTTFEDALMNSARFGESDLSNVSFSGADLSNAEIRGSNLSFCSFDATKLINADFREAHLVSSSFQDADLSNVDLSLTNLARSNFQEANLRGVDFSEAQELCSATFELGYFDRYTRWPDSWDPLDPFEENPTDNTGCRWDSEDEPVPMPAYYVGIDSDLTNSILDGADLTNLSLIRANFTNASLVGAQINADLQEAIFLGADLSGAVIFSTIVDKTNMRQVTLDEAELSSTYFIGADLTGTDLTTVDILENVFFYDTICPDGTNSGGDEAGPAGSCDGHLTPRVSD